jgi:hypothetical protein
LLLVMVALVAVAGMVMVGGAVLALLVLDIIQ